MPFKIQHRRAAAGSQYALILGLIGIAGLLAVTLLGSNVRMVLQRSANALGNAAAGSAGAGDGGGGGGSAPAPGTAAYAWGGVYGAVPVALPGATQFSRIAGPGSAGGQSGACGIDGGGALHCWDDGGAPAAKAGGVSFRDIAAGAALGGGGDVAYCGIDTAGAIWCWARGDAAPTAYPATAGAPVFSRLALSAWSACALSSAGQYCWGANWYGIFGDGGATPDSTRPQPVNPGRSFTSLAAGYNLMCGLDGAGKAWCSGMAWGDIPGGSTPTALMPARSFSALAVGQHHVCGLSGGQAYCTGASGNNRGQLGGASDTVPIAGIAFSALGAGDTYSCGVAGSGAGYCWGANGSGRLGNGTVADASTPQAIAPPAGGSPLAFSAIVGSGAGGGVTYGLLR